MKFDTPLTAATLIKRYKRFLADVIMPDGGEITVHTPNTGSMSGCAEPGSVVYLRDTQNPKRKYLWSWEMSTASNGTLVGVHTGLANKLVHEAIGAGLIGDLGDYPERRPEVRYGESSRIDWLLQGEGRPDCYVEVKNVTLARERLALFPDAVTARGAKHLQELMGMVAAGDRAAMVYCVQRGDVDAFSPADDVDPHYGALLRQALAAGVEVYTMAADVSPQGVRLCRPLGLELG